MQYTKVSSLESYYPKHLYGTEQVKALHPLDVFGLMAGSKAITRTVHVRVYTRLGPISLVCSLIYYLLPNRSQLIC